MIGFGFWWLYFDLIGRRPPRRESGVIATWLLGHLPITMSIAAAAAAMVSLDRPRERRAAHRRALRGWCRAPSRSNLLALILTERTAR